MLSRSNGLLLCAEEGRRPLDDHRLVSGAGVSEDSCGLSCQLLLERRLVGMESLGDAHLRHHVPQEATKAPLCSLGCTSPEVRMARHRPGGVRLGAVFRGLTGVAADVPRLPARRQRGGSW